MMDLTRHPCFSDGAHGRYGRMHIPCAPRCNLDCAFCGRGLDAGETRLPGCAMTIVRPEEVVGYVSERLARHPEIHVLGIAGPGEPLFNPETFEVLQILRKNFPDQILCLGTNGLLLPEFVDRLWTLGVRTLTVTVNAINPETEVRLNARVIVDDDVLFGAQAARQLIDRRLEGVARASERGMEVKVNTVYVPGVNDGELREIAEAARDRGARLMNLMPLHPAGRLSGACPPRPEAVHALRDELASILPQMRHCSQCRADACGVLGEWDGGGCVK